MFAVLGLLWAGESLPTPQALCRLDVVCQQWSQDSLTASLTYHSRRGSACPTSSSQLPTASFALVMLVQAFTGQVFEVSAHRLEWDFTIAMPAFL